MANEINDQELADLEAEAELRELEREMATRQSAVIDLEKEQGAITEPNFMADYGAPIAAGGIEIGGAIGGGLLGTPGGIPGVVAGATLGEEVARQGITEPLGLRPQTDILSMDTLGRTSTSLVANTLSPLIGKYLLGGKEAATRLLRAKKPMAAQMGLGNTAAQRVMGDEVERAEKTLISSGLLEGGNAFDPLTMKFIVQDTVDPVTGAVVAAKKVGHPDPTMQLTPRDISDNISKNLPVVTETRNAAIQTADDIAKSLRDDTGEKIGLITVDEIMPQFDGLRKHIAKLQKSGFTKGQADNASEVLQTLVDDLYPIANAKSVSKKLTISEATDYIDNIHTAMRTLGAFDDRVASQGLTNESIEARLKETTGVMRQLSQGLKTVRTNALKEVEAANPKAFKEAGLKSETVDELNNTLHDLLDLRKGFDFADAKVRIGPMAREAAGAIPVMDNPSVGSLIKSGAKKMGLYNPEQAIYDNEAKMVSNLLDIAKTRQAGKVGGIGGFADQVTGRNRLATSVYTPGVGSGFEAMGRMALTGSPLEPALVPTFDDKVRELELPKYPIANIPNDARDIFTSQETVLATTTAMKQRMAAEAMNDLEKSGKLAEILQSPDGDAQLQQYLTSYLEPLRPVEQGLIKAQSAQSKLEKYEVLANVAASFPEFFPEPKSGIRGEILVGGKSILPRMQDRALYSVTIKDDPDLDIGQKARMRSAVNKTGEVIFPKSRSKERWEKMTGKSTKPEIAEDL